MLDKGKVQEYTARLLFSRMRILEAHGFYGLLLMHMTFAIDEGCHTAATDGVRIYFGPDFLQNLSDSELDFIMMHEILHVALLHVLRGAELDNDRFNVACDIVVNSNIMLERGTGKPIRLKHFGEAMHLTPNGKPGHLYTAEEVYEMLPANKKTVGQGSGGGKDSGSGLEEGLESGWKTGRAGQKQGKADSFADDHTRWSTGMEADEVLRDVWVKHIMDAAAAIEIQNSTKGRGTLPAFAKRMIKKLKSSQIDWRAILNDFIQEEINDYSFSPPDRRFDDSPFFLPDFNEKDEAVRNVLFMIDTSGSMSDDAITAAFSEIYGAVAQFGGKLAGKLGFFDAAIIDPIPFEDVGDLKKIEAAGGGGTDFQIIFEYVVKHMEEDPPVSIIILTDGYAPFPAERLTNGIPVLWLLNNEEAEPPWGKVARIAV